MVPVNVRKKPTNPNKPKTNKTKPQKLPTKTPQKSPLQHCPKVWSAGLEVKCQCIVLIHYVLSSYNTQNVNRHWNSNSARFQFKTCQTERRKMLWEYQIMALIYMEKEKVDVGWEKFRLRIIMLLRGSLFRFWQDSNYSSLLLLWLSLHILLAYPIGARALTSFVEVYSEIVFAEVNLKRWDHDIVFHLEKSAKLLQFSLNAEHPCHLLLLAFCFLSCLRISTWNSM